MQLLWPCCATWQALERLSRQLASKAGSAPPSLSRGYCGRKKTNAGCPPSPRHGSRGGLRSSLSGGPCQRTGRPGSSERGQPSWAASRGPLPLLCPSFALQACSGRRGSKLAAAVPRLGKPTRQHSPIPTPSLPAPWALALTRPLAGTSQWPFGEGAQAAVPHHGPPLLPWPLPVSQPLSSLHSCPPQPGSTVPQRPEGASLRSQGLGPPRAAKSPCAASRAGLRPLQHEATASPKAPAAPWLLAGRASRAFSRDPSLQKGVFASHGALQKTSVGFPMLPH